MKINVALCVIVCEFLNILEIRCHTDEQVFSFFLLSNRERCARGEKISKFFDTTKKIRYYINGMWSL